MMVKTGFDEMSERFEARLEERDKTSNARFDVLVDSLRLLRDDVQDIKTRFNGMSELVISHDKDIDKIKEHVGLD